MQRRIHRRDSENQAPQKILRPGGKAEGIGIERINVRVAARCRRRAAPPRK